MRFDLFTVVMPCKRYGCSLTFLSFSPSLQLMLWWNYFLSKKIYLCISKEKCRNNHWFWPENGKKSVFSLSLQVPSSLFSLVVAVVVLSAIQPVQVTSTNSIFSFVSEKVVATKREIYKLTTNPLTKPIVDGASDRLNIARMTHVFLCMAKATQYVWDIDGCFRFVSFSGVKSVRFQIEKEEKETQQLLKYVQINCNLEFLWKISHVFSYSMPHIGIGIFFKFNDIFFWIFLHSSFSIRLFSLSKCWLLLAVFSVRLDGWLSFSLCVCTLLIFVPICMFFIHAHTIFAH